MKTRAHLLTVAADVSAGIAAIMLAVQLTGVPAAVGVGTAMVYAAVTVWSRLLSRRANRREPLGLAVGTLMAFVFIGTFAYAALGWWWIAAIHATLVCVALSATMRERGVTRAQVLA